MYSRATRVTHENIAPRSSRTLVPWQSLEAPSWRSCELRAYVSRSWSKAWLRYCEWGPYCRSVWSHKSLIRRNLSSSSRARGDAGLRIFGHPFLDATGCILLSAIQVQPFIRTSSGPLSPHIVLTIQDIILPAISDVWAALRGKAASKSPKFRTEVRTK